jgi:hypothetical protein
MMQKRQRVCRFYPVFPEDYRKSAAMRKLHEIHAKRTIVDAKWDD